MATKRVTDLCKLYLVNSVYMQWLGFRPKLIFNTAPAGSKKTLASKIDFEIISSIH